MFTRVKILVILAIVCVGCQANAPSAGGSADGASQDTATVKAAIEAANARFLRSNGQIRRDSWRTTPMTPS